MRALTAQRWANARETLLQGRRPNSDNASQLRALDVQLQTVSNNNQSKGWDLDSRFAYGLEVDQGLFKPENRAGQRAERMLGLDMFGL
jgi:hypothetical protein